MRNNRPQSLHSLLDDASLLRDIQQRATVLLKLNNAVKSLLPTPLQNSCRVANFRHGILILEVANANWLMRLKYEQSNLLTTLRQDILPSLVTIELRINPTLDALTANPAKMLSIATTTEKPRKMSKQTGQQLKELAKRAPEELRIKLERLAALAGEGAITTNRSEKK